MAEKLHWRPHGPQSLKCVLSGSLQISHGNPGGSDTKESACKCRRPGFNPWAGKIPWRRARQPTPVLLPVHGVTKSQTRLSDCHLRDGGGGAAVGYPGTFWGVASTLHLLLGFKGCHAPHCVTNPGRPAAVTGELDASLETNWRQTHRQTLEATRASPHPVKTAPAEKLGSLHLEVALLAFPG